MQLSSKNAQKVSTFSLINTMNIWRQNGGIIRKTQIIWKVFAFLTVSVYIYNINSKDI